MKLRDMLAAAVRPLVDVRRARIDGDENRSSVAHVTEVIVRRGRFGNASFGPDGWHLRVGGFSRNALRIDAGKARDGNKRRRPYTETSVQVLGHQLRLERNSALLRVATGPSYDEGHTLSVAIPWAERHPFSWGKPSVECQLGDLSVRYVSRAANDRGHAEYVAKAAAEHTANDSKAAA